MLHSVAAHDARMKKCNLNGVGASHVCLSGDLLAIYIFRRKKIVTTDGSLSREIVDKSFLNGCESNHSLKDTSDKKTLIEWQS